MAASLSNLSLSERLGGIGGIGAGHIHGGPGTTEGDGYSAKGEFADASLGLRTREVDLDPDVIRVYGGLWLVVEQIGGGGQGHVTEGSDDDGGGGGGGSGGDGVHVEISSDGVVNIGEWEVANED